MQDFCNYFPFYAVKNFADYAAQLEKCDSDTKSYVLFGIDHITKSKNTAIHYWFTAHLNPIKVVKLNFRTKFFELASLSFFKESIISSSLIPNEVRRRYDQIISLALLRVRLVAMEADLFGLTVPTKYIFIRAFANNDEEFKMAGVFLVFLHEMIHYVK